MYFFIALFRNGPLDLTSGSVHSCSSEQIHVCFVNVWWLLSSKGKTGGNDYYKII